MDINMLGDNEIAVDYIDFVRMWNDLRRANENDPEKLEILDQLKHRIWLRNELYYDEIGEKESAYNDIII